jgi:hypothetical protein
MSVMAGTGGGGSPPEPMSGTGGTIMMPPKEPCTTEGALRCSQRGAGQRDACSGGFWTLMDACKTGEICRSQPGAMDGSCQMVAEICRGSAGLPVCDSQGVMYQCSAEGVIESMSNCSSEKHCELGISNKKCLNCIPGEFRCTEKKLEKCDAAGMAFVMDKECPTAALCNAKVGDCTDAACVANKLVCDDDVLKKCNADQTALEDVKPCMPGMCDNAAGECDVCTPGKKTCEGDTVVTCNGQGQAYTRAPCGGSTRQCVGAGQCVACAADADCGDPGACKLRHCNLATGTCAPQNATEGDDCTGGVCSGGSCVGCLSPNDCPADPGVCKVKGCSANHVCAPQNAADGTACNGTDVCNAGKCVACRKPEDCDMDPGQCKVKGCSATNTCAPQSAPNGADCRIGSRAGVCNSGTCIGCRNNDDCARINPELPICNNGSCVACTQPSHCDTPAGGCRRAVCSNNQCGEEITPWASCGPGRVCDEGGVCGTACPNGHIDADEECEDGVDGWNQFNCERASCKRLGYRTCSVNSTCKEGASCGVTGGVCAGNCQSVSCSFPPAGSTAICYADMFCALICDSDAECPDGLTCVTDLDDSNGNPNPKRGACVAKPECCTGDFGCFGCFWPSGV